MTEGHGDDAYRYGCDIKYNFSTNVYGGFDHSGLTAHLCNVADCIRSYPEPVPVSVEAALASLKEVGPEAVMVTNGATEAIYIMACELAGRQSAVIAPTFSEYADACMMYSHRLKYVFSLDDVSDDVEVVWMCNPNNPTGRVTDKARLLSFVDSHPRVLFVIDQAYADYTLLPVVTDREAVERHNLVLLGSLTKRFAIPGLRIGYAVGCPSLLARFKSRRMPWSVNQLAIEGAKYLLGHIGDFPIDVSMLHREAERVGESLGGIGIHVEPTDCNMLLCRLERGTAAALKEYLVTKHGMLIRDASNFHGLTERHFRVAVLSPAENDMLITAITKWIL